MLRERVHARVSRKPGRKAPRVGRGSVRGARAGPDKLLPAIIGHRGSPDTHPENSVLGFAALAASQVVAAECDVRLTRDEALVCSHDPSPARLGGTNAPISHLTLAEVQGQILRGGVRIPTLDEVLDACGGQLELVIELKNNPAQPGFRADRRSAVLLAELLGARSRQGAGDRVRAVSSFDAESISAFTGAVPEPALRGALLGSPYASPVALLDEAERRGVRHVHLHFTALLRRPAVLGRASARGIQVTTWTVNNRRMAHRLLDLGVAGVITDRPGQLVDLLPQSPAA